MASEAERGTGDVTLEEPKSEPQGFVDNVKKAKEESSGFVTFTKAFCIILASSIGCTICVGLVLLVPIIMIAIGSVHLHDCPIERYIPIYLIVAGVFGALASMSSMAQRCRNSFKKEDEENAKPSPISGVLSCFLLAWFIAGNVWIYSVYNDWEKNEEISPGVPNPNYCHPTLYYFAFWITTLKYIFMLISCFSFCCGLVCAHCCGGDKD